LSAITHQILDDQLPQGWRYRTEGSGSSWHAIAWAPDGRFIEARARTFQHALAELTRRVAAPRTFMRIADARPEGYPEPPRTGAIPRPKAWRWPADADAFLEEICFGQVDIDKQRIFLARFKRTHAKDYVAMPSALRSQLADRGVLPGSYWPTDAATVSLLLERPKAK
jgi:hypothetical protein